MILRNKFSKTTVSVWALAMVLYFPSPLLAQDDLIDFDSMIETPELAPAQDDLVKPVDNNAQAQAIDALDEEITVYQGTQQDEAMPVVDETTRWHMRMDGLDNTSGGTI